MEMRGKKVVLFYMTRHMGLQKRHNALHEEGNSWEFWLVANRI